MSGYPVIYWLVVAFVSGVVSLVLVGWGYLLGLDVAARRLAQVREELEQNQARRCTTLHQGGAR